MPRALLTQQVNPGSLYRCGRSTFKRAICAPWREERDLKSAPKNGSLSQAGADWLDVLGEDPSKVIKGGQSLTVSAPLDTIPVYSRK